MTRKGSCLCGALRYEIEGDFDGVWMCHCSNCRKTSGATGNTILIVPRERFRWLSGDDHRVTYALRPSYKITRCKTCGTPLPAEEDEQNIYLTAGTLDDPLGAGIKNHIFYGSRADWDREPEGVRYFVERSTGPECVLDKPRTARGGVRVIAIAVVSRPSDGALLVYDAYDTVKREAYHRPLGGGFEFGETAEAAVRRELREELGAELEDVALLGYLENIFTCDGRPGHQIVAVFSARLADASLYTRDELPFVDNVDVPGTARWVNRAAFRSEQNPDGPPLYPDGLAALHERTLG